MRQKHKKEPLSHSQAMYLCRFSLKNREHISKKEEIQIRNNPTTMHLFAFNNQITEFNIRKLKDINNNENPVAKLNPLYSSCHISAMKTTSRHFEAKGDKYDSTYLARGCKVELKGRNIAPQYGLYNGAMGIVMDIVFNQHESPHTGHLPRYVMVHFPAYTGPQFCDRYNNIIPIVPITSICYLKCCKRTFVPLQLCYAKTIHKFQGQSAGPVGPSQQPNAIQQIVIDIGTRQFEGKAPGLTYTGVSRGTCEQAIFFDGEHIQPDRFIDIGRSLKTGTLYKLVQMREKWVQFLKKNTHTSGLTKDEIATIFFWAETFRATGPQIKAFQNHFKY